MTRCAEDELAIVEMTDDPATARAALDEHRADRLVTAREEHAIDVFPEITVAHKRPRRLGVAVMPLVWLVQRARDHQAAAAVAVATGVAGGVASVPMIVDVPEGQTLAEPPAAIASAPPPRPSDRPPTPIPSPAAQPVTTGGAPTAPATYPPAAPQTPSSPPTIESTSAPPSVEVPAPAGPPAVELPPVVELPTPGIALTPAGEEDDGAEDQECLDVETGILDVRVCVDDPDG